MLRKLLTWSTKPGYQSSKRPRCIAPGMLCSSSQAAIAAPKTFTQRYINGCGFSDTGSPNGGIQMRAGNGAVW